MSFCKCLYTTRNQLENGCVLEHMMQPTSTSYSYSPCHHIDHIIFVPKHIVKGTCNIYPCIEIWIITFDCKISLSTPITFICKISLSTPITSHSTNLFETAPRCGVKQKLHDIRSQIYMTTCRMTKSFTSLNCCQWACANSVSNLIRTTAVPIIIFCNVNDNPLTRTTPSHCLKLPSINNPEPPWLSCRSLFSVLGCQI